MSKKELIVGVLLIPVMAAMMLSGMAIANEVVTDLTVAVFAASVVVFTALVIVLRGGKDE